MRFICHSSVVELAGTMWRYEELSSRSQAPLRTDEHCEEDLD